jgi:hypothetical protein
MIKNLSRLGDDRWRAPKSLISPKLGLGHSSCEISGTRGTLPASNTKGGWEGRVESFGIRLGRGTSLLSYRSCIQIQPTSWLELILHTFNVGTSHGQPWIHLTHHGPDSREATTFPHIVLSVALCRTCIQMALFPGTPKMESQNCPDLDSWDFGRS